MNNNQQQEKSLWLKRNGQKYQIEFYRYDL
jgi:hypothetical protein